MPHGKLRYAKKDNCDYGRCLNVISDYVWKKVNNRNAREEQWHDQSQNCKPTVRMI